MFILILEGKGTKLSKVNISIQNTSDGSQTLYSEQFNETYHSVNGAVTESLHVFIDTGFMVTTKSDLQIFEVGFGTGLNALLTLQRARKLNRNVSYHAIELFPVSSEVFEKLDYASFTSNDTEFFGTMHRAPWNAEVRLTPNFVLTKVNGNLLNYNHPVMYDLVYFDAFSPAIQPELWSEDIFRKIYAHMNPNGILTTYCAKGAVRRTLQQVGFTTERLPGSPGKREMLRATKHQ